MTTFDSYCPDTPLTHGTTANDEVHTVGKEHDSPPGEVVLLLILN